MKKQRYLECEEAQAPAVYVLTAKKHRYRNLSALKPRSRLKTIAGSWSGCQKRAANAVGCHQMSLHDDPKQLATFFSSGSPGAVRQNHSKP